MTAFVWIWIIALVFKLALGAWVPLSADESYYWVWSHHLQLSYFDHPPMVSWLFYLGHWLEPFAHAVRWPFVIVGHLTLLVWYHIIGNRFSSQQHCLWLVVVLSLPLLGFGSLVATPDIPVLFFWSLAILAIEQVISTQSRSAYALLGASLGLGFCSKYHIVLLVILAFIGMLFDPQMRKLNPRKIGITLITGLIFSLPVIAWNWQNDFASFRFQLNHGLGRPDYKLEWTWGYLLGQVALVSPWVLWGALNKSQLRDPWTRRQYLFGVGPLVFFALTSFRGVVEANWPIVGYFSLVTLAILIKTNWKDWRWHLASYGALYASVIVLVLMPTIPKDLEKIKEPWVYQDLADLPQKYSPLFGSTYQMSSAIWYLAKSPVYKIQGMGRFDFFNTLQPSIPVEDVFFLVIKKEQSLPDWMNGDYSVTKIEERAPYFEVLKIERK